jgi:hypothetical protein
MPDYRKIAAQAARRHGVPVALFLAQINQESGFNPNAVSPAGAVGIAQIVPRWHPGVNPRDPVASLNYAAQLMASLKNRYGTWRDALSAYNSGRPWSQGQRIPETRNYVTLIMRRAGTGRGAAGGSTGSSVGSQVADAVSTVAEVSRRLIPRDLVRKLMEYAIREDARLSGRKVPGGVPNFNALVAQLTRLRPASRLPGLTALGTSNRVTSTSDRGTGHDPYQWAKELARQYGLRLSSTYRSPAENARVGGSPTSRHMLLGGAADFSGTPEAMRRLAEWAIRSRRFSEVFYDPVGQYDNGVYSRRGIGGHSDHVHISR